MALALHYHMFQMVIIANNGKYGGSNAYAPYRDAFKRQVFHLHGQPQASIAFFEIENTQAFLDHLHRNSISRNQISGSDTGTKKRKQLQKNCPWKFPPAGI